MFMKHLILVILLFVVIQKTTAQTYEIGGMVAGTNYMGDIGPINYVSPNDVAVGLLFRWNRTPRHSFRFSFMYAGLNSDDADAKEPRRLERNYSFSNTVLEASMGIEFTFWEFDTHSTKPQNAPYLYSGISYFNYESLILGQNNQIEKNGNDQAFAIPMAIGYKITVGRYFIFGVEIGARYTFTDNLDGSNPTNISTANPDLNFGNLNNNDWYVFSGINLTIKFGRKPCFCSF